MSGQGQGKKKPPVKAADDANPYRAGAMQDRRVGLRLSKVEADLESIAENVSIIAGRIPEPEATEALKKPLLRFDTKEGRAAHESVVRDNVKTTRDFLSMAGSYRNLYGLMDAGQKAQGDTWADLNVMHADFNRRRSRWDQLERLRTQHSRLGILVKLVPWIVVAIVSSLLVYGLIISPQNFSLWTHYLAGNPAAEVAILASLGLLLASSIIFAYVSRKRKREGKEA